MKIRTNTYMGTYILCALHLPNLLVLVMQRANLQGFNLLCMWCHWFIVGFGYLTMQGRCCRNLQLTLLFSFIVGEAIAKIIPHCPRLVTL